MTSELPNIHNNRQCNIGVPLQSNINHYMHACMWHTLQERCCHQEWLTHGCLRREHDGISNIPLHLYWCQHIQTCNSKQWIRLALQHRVVLRRCNIQGAGHTQRPNFDYNSLVVVPLMPTLQWNAVKEYILKTNMHT